MLLMRIKPVSVVKQFFCYILGLLIIALGINVAKMSMLGISPVSSIPRACEVIFAKLSAEGSSIESFLNLFEKIGGLTLGNMTIAIYILLVLLQIIVLRKKFPVRNLLGIAVAIGFGKMVDLMGIDPKAFGHLLLRAHNALGLGCDLTQSHYLVRLAYLLSSTLIIGVGVFLYLRPKWVPMPAEGLAGAISSMSGKVFGNCKTGVDCSMILIALVLQLIFLGGLKSFTGDIVVVREGTVISAVFIGQIVKFLSKKLGNKADKLLGLK